jgi:hypothetical protein
MSRHPWHLFATRWPHAHLVVAVLDGAQAGPGPKQALLALMRLVRQQDPVGAYATTIVREAGRPEILLAFQEENDSRTLGNALHAKEVAGVPPWMTRQVIHLDDAAIAAIAASLPSPRLRSRRSASEGSGNMAIQRVARAPNRRFE